MDVDVDVKNQKPNWTGLDWTGLDCTGHLQHRTLLLTGPGVGFRVLGAFWRFAGVCEEEVAADPALVLSLISSREAQEEEKNRNSRD